MCTSQKKQDQEPVSSCASLMTYYVMLERTGLATATEAQEGNSLAVIPLPRRVVRHGLRVKVLLEHHEEALVGLGVSEKVQDTRY